MNFKQIIKYDKWLIGLILLSAISLFWVYGLYQKTENDLQKFVRMDANHLEKFIQLTEDYLKDNPDDINANLQLGFALSINDKNSSRAINCLERARDLGSLSPSIFSILGRLYEKNGLFKEAILSFKRYLAHDPNNREYRIRLANLHFRLDQIDEAIDELENVYRSYSRDPVILINLARCYFQKGLLDEAEQKLGELQDVVNNLPPEGNYLLGEIYLSKGDYQQAISNFKMELNLDPKFTPAWIGLARTYEKSGNKQEALTTWKKILQLDPANREAKTKLRPALSPRRKRK